MIMENQKKPTNAQIQRWKEHAKVWNEVRLQTNENFSMSELRNMGAKKNAPYRSTIGKILREHGYIEVVRDGAKIGKNGWLVDTYRFTKPIHWSIIAVLVEHSNKTSRKVYSKRKKMQSEKETAIPEIMTVSPIAIENRPIAIENRPIATENRPIATENRPIATEKIAKIYDNAFIEQMRVNLILMQNANADSVNELMQMLENEKFISTLKSATDSELVNELRSRGFNVSAKKTIEL